VVPVTGIGILSMGRIANIIGKRIWLLVWLLSWGFALTGAAQSPQALLQEAERQLGLHAYARSIEIYTQLLTESNSALTDEQRILAQANLGLSYKQAGNLLKAEDVYRDLVTNTNLKGAQVISYLHFAQVLASNGKYRESQGMYEKYNSLKSQLPAQSMPAVGGEMGTIVIDGKRVPPKFRLEVLDLNTSNAEFSPAYYGNGLVYVSGKKGGSAIETVGLGGGGNYLDLFFVPDRQQLKIDRIIRSDGTVFKPNNPTSRRERTASEPQGARPTANDSRTIGSYDGSINVTQGLGIGQSRGSKVNPATAQRFSKELNTRYHEGPATFFSDGSRIIFTRNNYSSGRVRQSTDGVTNLKLYTAEQQNGTWVNVQELPFNSEEYSVGHPALSKDDKLLFFASDMPGGFGGTDIYVSRYVNGSWSKPVNLGRTVNTKGNELFPFVDDRNNLYFSSDGFRGLGGLDLYCGPLMGNGTQVGQVIHLDAPLSSDQDDFGIVTDGLLQTGYLSTNRFDGSDDIVRFVRESGSNGCRNLTIRIMEQESGQLLDSVQFDIRSRREGRPSRTLTVAKGVTQICLEADDDFVFQASKDGYVTSTVGFSTRAVTDDSPTQLAILLDRPRPFEEAVDPAASVARPPAKLRKSRIRGVVKGEHDRRPIEGVTVRLRSECDGRTQQMVTSADGRYEFELTEGCDYTLVASKNSYGTNTNKIKRLPQKTVPKVVSADLNMFKVGDIVRLDNIYYDMSKWNIRADAARELDKLVTILRKYPGMQVEIRSHTDSRGDDNANKYLSAQRANSIVNYLASKGISRKRLVAAGYGETMPVNNCVDGVSCTEEEHQRNRRTEFKVLAL